MILIFSHTLTEKQIQDAKESLNVNQFIYLSQESQEKWSLIPPNIGNISNITDEIKEWITTVADKNDYILVQGDFGATYDIVNYCKLKGLKVVYSTTKRVTKEIPRSDGKIEVIHEFDHVMYREY